MKNKTTNLIILLLLLGLSNLFASENGGYAGSYLRLGLGARAQAMGNAGVAGEPSGYSFYYNPALSGFIDTKVFSLSSSFMSLDRSFNFIGYGMKVPPGAGFSVGWINSGVADLRTYNLIGEETGEADHSLNAAYFNFARVFKDKLSIGLSIKYMWETLGFSSDEYSSSGWGWDFGIAYRYNERLTVAATLRDVASKLKANTDKLFERGGTTIDKFPRLYAVGARYQTPLDWLNVLYDFEGSDKGQYNSHLGFEAVHGDILALRFGLNDDNFTAGAGMGFKLYRFFSKLDYAFLPSVEDEGSSHVFSWQIYFN